ncbi:MAG TPA: rhodanese-like domain-containing protein [Acetobacteraceae bacterium]|nr:rhodanese-like domain-containing protein [Acetobacteraceae bacterium]
MNIRALSAADLRAALVDGSELAILDAREEGEFARAHLFWAVPCPLSVADLRAPSLLPRRGVRIVTIDGGGGEAERLARLLAGLGCTDVSVLAGGIAAWKAAGGELFSGVNVPSKAFGEWVEHHYGTQSIDAAELQRKREEGAGMVVLDARTFEEFQRMSIPGGISVPGGELVYRIGDLAPDPETLVVVNCAGRTRSILGAESLRQARIPNKVLALRNGTMGWELAGLTCARGATGGYPAGTPASTAIARARATRFAEEAGVRTIDHAELAALSADPARSLYRLDVRSPAEYRAGHLPSSRSAPGGQLVQATDGWVAVRGARLVLIDDTGVRARMAGGWLARMAPWEVLVLEDGPGDGLAGPLETGPEPRPAAPPVSLVNVSDLVSWRDLPGTMPDTVIIDCAKSLDYRAGHIPGALWGLRGRLGALAPTLASAERVVLTSPDGWLAAHATAEAAALTQAPVHVLAGGTESWRQAGESLAATPADPPDEACIDVNLRPYDRASGAEEAMRAYLSWEIGLAEQIGRESSVAFGVRGDARL